MKRHKNHFTNDRFQTAEAMYQRLLDDDEHSEKMRLLDSKPSALRKKIAELRKKIREYLPSAEQGMRTVVRESKSIREYIRDSAESHPGGIVIWHKGGIYKISLHRSKCYYYTYSPRLNGPPIRITLATQGLETKHWNKLDIIFHTREWRKKMSLEEELVYYKAVFEFILIFAHKYRNVKYWFKYMHTT